MDLTDDDVRIGGAKVLARSSRVESGCLEFTGYRDPQGYGRVYIGRHPFIATRIVWRAQRGAIPDGMCICHRCDNPACVDIDHLFLGTVGDNNRDATSKGRRAKGERHGSAKLSAGAIADILYSGDGRRDLAARYSVNVCTIDRVRSGRSWADARSAAEVGDAK